MIKESLRQDVHNALDIGYMSHPEILHIEPEELTSILKSTYDYFEHKSAELILEHVTSWQENNQ